MQPSSAASLPYCGISSSVPNRLNNLNLHPPLKVKSNRFTLSPSKYPIHHKLSCSLALSPSSSCGKKQEKGKTRNDSQSYRNTAFFQQSYSTTDTGQTSNQDPEPRNQARQEQRPSADSKSMWWADLKAAVGQRFNSGGVVSSAAVVARDRHLALPHVAVPDIRYIDWAELHRRGFRGVVFDKDNTITAPYCLSLWGSLASSLELCKSVFGQNIAVFSNSAGLCEYDHDGSKARALEKAIGIKVIRHTVKKPAGSAEEIEKHFGCKSSQLIMVGDRPFTDVVFGNRNGFLTILTEPLSLSEEPFIVRQVRKVESALLNNWREEGLKPSSHSLLADAMQCVKEPPTS